MTSPKKRKTRHQPKRPESDSVDNVYANSIRRKEPGTTIKSDEDFDDGDYQPYQQQKQSGIQTTAVGFELKIQQNVHPL